jgi:hypothetical protein
VVCNCVGFTHFANFLDIQGEFESCAEILTSDRTPQKVTIELIMPYTNVDIFREKGAKSFSQKNWRQLNFINRMGKQDFSVVIYSKNNVRSPMSNLTVALIFM